jgi:hypothetical protein
MSYQHADMGQCYEIIVEKSNRKNTPNMRSLLVLLYPSHSVPVIFGRFLNQKKGLDFKHFLYIVLSWVISLSVS